jgi:hypothetical protein
MASVFKPAGKSKYVIVYIDENGRRRKKVVTTDKAVSERIAREIENRVALRKLPGQGGCRHLRRINHQPVCSGGQASSRQAV